MIQLVEYWPSMNKTLDSAPCKQGMVVHACDPGVRGRDVTVQGHPCLLVDLRQSRIYETVSGGKS